MNVTRAFTNQTIMTLVMRGMLRANSDYWNWSKGHHVFDNGIESLASSEIARSFFELIDQNSRGFGVTLESSVRDVVLESNRVRNSSCMRLIKEGGRLDVVVWSKRERPIGIVEVKRYFSSSSSEYDLERISDVLGTCGTLSGGSLRWAVIAGMRRTGPGNRKSPKLVLDDARRKFQQRYPQLRFHGSIQSEEIDWKKYYSPRHKYRDRELHSLCVLVKPLRQSHAD